MKLLALIVTFASLAHAQVEGSCWEVKSDLKKVKRYTCSAVNPSPFTVPFSQHHIFKQLSAVRPLPHALVLERAADQNRKHGNSRLERFERNGLPIGSILGAAGVIGSGVVTAGVSAALPLLFPPIRKWFFEASPPLWVASEQLLSDQEIVMEPGSAIGFWFYAEKGDMQGEFKILPMEMEVVEKRFASAPSSEIQLSASNIVNFTDSPSNFAVRRVVVKGPPPVYFTPAIPTSPGGAQPLQPVQVPTPTSAPTPSVYYIHTVQ